MSINQGKSGHDVPTYKRLTQIISRLLVPKNSSTIKNYFSQESPPFPAGVREPFRQQLPQSVR